MNLNDFKKQLSELSDDDFNALYSAALKEKKSRGSMVDKSSLMLCSDILKILSPYFFERDDEFLSDQLVANMAHDMEKSIFCICDYITGNLVINKNGKVINKIRRPSGSTIVPRVSVTKYIDLKNDLLEVLRKHYDYNTIRKRFQENDIFEEVQQ